MNSAMSTLKQISIGAMAAALILTIATGAGAQVNKQAEMTVESAAFQNGQRIPKQYTGDGKDMSPPLEWTASPANTKCFVLICDDPDAPMGTWVHWVVFDIPASVHSLNEATPPSAVLAGGGKQGNTSFHKVGYGGPAPPVGKPHRYFFKLYALDKELGLKSGATKEEVTAAMSGHVLAEAQTMGTYSR